MRKSCKVFNLVCGLSAVFLLYAKESVANDNTIFVTNDHWYGGDIKNISGADQKCRDEAAKLPHEFQGTYKAMIVGENGLRSKTKDWVLKPNTEYFNIDSKSIGITNESALFDKNLTDFIYDIDLKTHKRVWTGLRSNWDTSNYDCSNWDSGSGAQGVYGSSNSKDINNVINDGKENCGDYGQNHGSRGHLYCVQQ